MMKESGNLSLRSTSVNKRRSILAGLAIASLLAVAGPASADSGGVPHGSPDTCGVGQAETVDFRSDSTLPGVSEISLYPPVAFGCTGKH
jgi:hypothetical protein